MFIEGFGISSYRSFGTEIQFIGPCNKINFLIGQNNSGKSNILRFLKDHFHNALKSARHPRNTFAISELDRHLGQNTGEIKIAFGFKHSGEVHKMLFERKKIPFEHNQATLLVNRFLQFPEITDARNVSWFIYEAGAGQPLTLSDEFIKKIAQNRFSNLPNSVDGFSMRDWRNLASVLVDRTPSVNSIQMVMDELPRILQAISPIHFDVPAITVIQAVREIKIDSSKSHSDFSGLNIIKELVKLERPDIDEKYQDSKNRFEKINQFVKDVIGKPDARIEIPASEKTIHIEMDGKTLPLENLGTGIHEVIILAIAATLLQDQIICIEEPEIHLHPLLQKKLVHYLEQTTNQYFITTHSASMIDIPNASVFHVRYNGEQSIVSHALSSTDRFSICVDLGYRASDILQSNCIIWVEGPSDRIYLKHWLKAFAPELDESIHYSIMFYGGRLLSHLSADDEEVDEFISLRRINRNLAIFIDSDRAKKGEKMYETKRRVRDEFDKGPGFAWITAGREVENYLPVNLVEAAIKFLHHDAVKLVSTNQYDHCYYFYKQNGEIKCDGIDKVKIARYVAQFEADLDVLDLRERIREVANFIRTCNDIPLA